MFKVNKKDTSKTRANCSSTLVSKLEQTLHCFSVSIAAFDKQVNIRCSTGCISRPISSRNHNAADQAVAMEQWAITEAISENLIFSFLENNRVQ